LRDADRRKDEFLAVLGHELRNPLGVISTAIQLEGRKNQADTELRELHETIGRQVAQMARLLDDLLDVARIGRGQVRLKKEPCNFTEIVRETAEDHRGLLQQSALNLAIELPDEALWVMGDPTRLAQIVGNALHNANKFTDPGGSVSVRLAKHEAQLCILTVQDTGIGMDSEMLAHAFEPFSQADRSIERSRGGLGLGLALVKGLVELQGGQVNIASKGTGRGVKLSIRFPLIETPAKEDKPMEPAYSHPRFCRILIIEDNQVAARSTRMFLAGDGHIVEVAHDGQSGIETARRFHPQVVLCDIGLPGLDGYAVCRALRQDPELKKAYLIAITGYGQQDDQLNAREAGFDFHLTKPIDLSELERILAGLTLNPTEPGADAEKRTVA